jgi:hypothetical protein
MRIVEYTPQRFDLLDSVVSRTASRNLRHRGFVDHYYASSPWCKLYLLVSGEDAVVGALGIERMPFRYASQEFTVGFGTNYYSLEPGAGGFLFLHWMKSCDVGISFGGSPDAHQLIRSQHWPYFDGVGYYLLNKPYKTYPGEPVWKTAAKWIARHTTRQRVSRYASHVPERIARKVSVREEFDYAADLLPRVSPFQFRFSPDIDYLAWRYNTRLPFVRYRLFRLLVDGRHTGYVILNDQPDQVLVSQCDGEDPESLAWGVILSILNVTRQDRSARTVVLTCCHPTMQGVYESFGFKKDSSHPFALGSPRKKVGPVAGSDTSNWLVNYDWGDNGLMELLES